MSSRIEQRGPSLAYFVLLSEHIVAARGLLRWSRKDLAERAGISLPSLKRIEQKKGPVVAYKSTVDAIQKAFEDQGIEFFNAGEPGVRLKAKPSGPSSIPPEDLNASNDE
jgi:transcriptional regulator with XRE-family HTH domain